MFKTGIDVRNQKIIENLYAENERLRKENEQISSSLADKSTETPQGILNILAESILASKPLSTKKGYDLVPTYKSDTGSIVWEYVKIDGYVPESGSYTNPVSWEKRMDIVAGINDDYVSDGWYVFDGLVQRCVKNGSPDTFTDTEYWEVIL